MTVTPQSSRPARDSRNMASEIVLGVVIIAGLIPIVWTLVLAFLPNRAIVTSSWDFPFWIGNFRTLFTDSTFLRQTLNSVAIVIGAVSICVVIGCLAGFALSRLNPPKWLTIPSLAVAAFIPLIPPMTLIPGLYVMLNAIGILGSVTGLIVVNALFNLPFAVLLLSSYFSGIPKELEEAAKVDGSSDLRTFTTVMVPLIKPGIAAVAIFVGIMSWNEFLMGLTLTSGGDTAPVTVGIAGLLQPYSVTWGEMAAAGTVAAVPIIGMSIFASRYIIAGLTSGAVKG